jgi:hypothetical protein
VKRDKEVLEKSENPKSRDQNHKSKSELKGTPNKVSQSQAGGSIAFVGKESLSSLTGRNSKGAPGILFDGDDLLELKKSNSNTVAGE